MLNGNFYHRKQHHQQEIEQQLVLKYDYSQTNSNDLMNTNKMISLLRYIKMISLLKYKKWIMNFTKRQ